MTLLLTQTNDVSLLLLRHEKSFTVVEAFETTDGYHA